jgi:hypothetical protein
MAYIGFKSVCDHGRRGTIVKDENVGGNLTSFPFHTPELAGTIIDRSLAAHCAHQLHAPLFALLV